MALVLDLATVERIKRLAIAAMFADEMLRRRVVLKGGNALAMVHGLAGRASRDLDFSMPDEFAPSDLADVQARFERAFRAVFRDGGFELVAFEFEEVPPDRSDPALWFWGGYRIRIKVIGRDRFQALANESTRQSHEAIVVDGRGGRWFKVDVSKHEHCDPTVQAEVGGYVVAAYTPSLVVIEKLRALCQQLPAYDAVIAGKNRSARARDFFDIVRCVDAYGIDVTASSAVKTAHRVFAAKRVPPDFLLLLPESREFHRTDVRSLEETVDRSVSLQPFDYYFDRVIEMAASLHVAWHV